MRRACACAPPSLDPAVTAEHRLPLDLGWSMWRTAAFRSAGMPFAWLEPLGTPEAGRTAVRGALRDPRFQEAIAWHNPTLVRNWLGDYLDALGDGDPPLARPAQRYALLAHYLQRFCVKNETVGAHGP